MIIIFYTHLEDYINELYKDMSINEPGQLSIKNIAKKLKINIIYGRVSLYFENYIVLKRSTSEKEWQLFGEEVCHYLRHIGNHIPMHELFMDYQENQANYFSYHFCVPTFMLNDIEIPTTHRIMETFNVEQHFAERRLEMYKNKLLLEGRRNESSLIRI